MGSGGDTTIPVPNENLQPNGNDDRQFGGRENVCGIRAFGVRVRQHAVLQRLVARSVGVYPQ